ncbi:MAG: Lrp/AsnC family transcriptional regulator [Candidatus Methanomethylophilaceae archaeon]|nr:Lrp/AsnC family transcriptional regulator [Candidatus Methanomethylophilaceae archaeon]MDY5872409.1 Lrp/AsnC family transcriptional regulator [Candidatus Methanomethylophilaceae archaeon]
MTELLDVKDIEILKALKVDSRRPMGVIGDEINISKATVSRRVAKMEEDGYIRGYTLDVDVGKMGLMKSLVSIQIVGSPVSVIIEQLRSYTEISTVYKAFGDHNIVCEVFTRNVDELYEMIQSKLLKMPSVRNVEVDILVESIPLNVNADLDLYNNIVSAPNER